jgi:hypothetical protein
MEFNTSKPTLAQHYFTIPQHSVNAHSFVRLFHHAAVRPLFPTRHGAYINANRWGI